MSPEGFSHAVDRYLASLQQQVEVAKSFYFERLGEGLEKFLALPEAQQLRVEQLIWEATKGEGFDPTDPSYARLIADALLFSVEEQMGMN